jgi:hypothetical protein
MKNKIDKAITKSSNIILIILFWVILFGFLGGLDLIKGAFAGAIVWLYIILRQGIILLLIVTPFYVVYRLLKGKE